MIGLVNFCGKKIVVSLYKVKIEGLKEMDEFNKFEEDKINNFYMLSKELFIKFKVKF